MAHDPRAKTAVMVGLVGDDMKRYLTDAEFHAEVHRNAEVALRALTDARLSVVDTDQLAALERALERTERNLRLAVNGKPVRDMTENLAENDAALSATSEGHECDPPDPAGLPDGEEWTCSCGERFNVVHMGPLRTEGPPDLYAGTPTTSPFLETFGADEPSRPTVAEMDGTFEGGPDSVEWLREQRGREEPWEPCLCTLDKRCKLHEVASDD